MNKKLISVLISMLLILAAVIPVYAYEEYYDNGADYEGEDGYLYAAEEDEYSGEEFFATDNDSYFQEGSIENDVSRIAADGGKAEINNGDVMTVNNTPEKKTFSAGRLIAALILGFLIGFVALKIVAAPLKSVRGQSNADKYAVPASFRLEYSNDAFLYKNLRKIPKPKTQQQQTKH